MVKRAMAKKRKAWRNAKIDDVEEALEDDRKINKLRKPKDKDAKSTELFTIDTSASCEGISGRSRRELARAKIFPPKPANIGLSAFEEAKIARAERALATRDSTESKVKSKTNPEVFDLWGEPAAKPPVSATAVRNLPFPVPQAPPKTLHQKVSAAPAVLPAHEGQSVNPANSAYEDLMHVAAAKQLEHEREIEELNRKMNPVTYELRDAVGEEELKNMDEASKNRMFCSLAGAGVGEGEAEDDKTGRPRATKKKQKSQSLRNREKKRKDIDARQKQLQERKKLEKSVGEVGAILKDMKREEVWQKQRKEYKRSLQAKGRELEASIGSVPKRRKLGRSRFVEEAEPVPEAEDLEKGSMRGMPLRQCAVKERFSSIVRRGLLPPPPEAQRSEIVRRKNGINKLRKGQRFHSPLLRDNNIWK